MPLEWVVNEVNAMSEVGLATFTTAIAARRLGQIRNPPGTAADHPSAQAA